jgi:hypothetical protein
MSLCFGTLVLGRRKVELDESTGNTWNTEVHTAASLVMTLIIQVCLSDDMQHVVAGVATTAHSLQGCCCR